MTMLYDFYGELLTDRQKEFFDLYYNEDLSLGEIAENTAAIARNTQNMGAAPAAPQQAAAPVCPTCGKPYAAGTKFCMSCGTPL